MGDLVKTQKRLVIDVADLKEERLERRYRERAPAYFRGLIRRARALTTEDLDGMLEPTVDLGRLSDAEANKADRPSRRSGGRRMPTACRSPIRRASPVSTPIRSAATTCKGTSSTRWKSNVGQQRSAHNGRWMTWALHSPWSRHSMTVCISSIACPMGRSLGMAITPGIGWPAATRS